jgi:Abortive infection C-terminus
MSNANALGRVAFFGRRRMASKTRLRRHQIAINGDPPAGLTAACSLLEALFKIFIEAEGLDMPATATVKPLWNAVGKRLGFDPAAMPDDDLKRILSGLTSVVDGLGSLRTHAGSAHGHGHRSYRVKPHHARLALNSAHALVAFLLETWDERKSESSP